MLTKLIRFLVPGKGFNKKQKSVQRRSDEDVTKTQDLGPSGGIVDVTTPSVAQPAAVVKDPRRRPPVNPAAAFSMGPVTPVAPVALAAPADTGQAAFGESLQQKARKLVERLEAEVHRSPAEIVADVLAELSETERQQMLELVPQLTQSNAPSPPPTPSPALPMAPLPPLQFAATAFPTAEALVTADAWSQPTIWPVGYPMASFVGQWPGLPTPTLPPTASDDLAVSLSAALHAATLREAPIPCPPLPTAVPAQNDRPTPPMAVKSGPSLPAALSAQSDGRPPPMAVKTGQPPIAVKSSSLGKGTSSSFQRMSSSIPPEVAWAKGTGATPKSSSIAPSASTGKAPPSGTPPQKPNPSSAQAPSFSGAADAERDVQRLLEYEAILLGSQGTPQKRAAEAGDDAPWKAMRRSRRVSRTENP